MTKIKLCGLTSLNDIHYANEAMPDYIGFVFAKSKRQIDFQTAAYFKQNLSPDIKAAGVFVNEDMAFIKQLCDENIIDMVQLHGDEDGKYLSQLKQLIDQPIIKAIRIENRFGKLQSDADYILFDTFHKNMYGGSGESFDWNLIAGFPIPFFLAGGLNITNIEKAVRLTKPFCVDVSSGVETNGTKDLYKMLEIVKKVRSIKKSEKSN